MEDKIKREHPVNAIECPKCGKQMRLRHVDDTTSVMGFDKDISFEEYFCKDCNLRVGTIEQIAAVQAKIANNYKEKTKQDINGLIRSNRGLKGVIQLD